MSAAYQCRWGILATGWIASVFTKDLLVDPATRNVSDVKHVVQAAASSSSLERARRFLDECGAPASAAAYGSYEELVKDPDVDVIYIATPHSHHFQNCLLALRAGKPVVCEKPFTVNAAQTKILIDLAREKGLFLMEAVWTRFFPLSVEVREMVRSGRIGDVRRVVADLSVAEDPEHKYADGKHRMVNPELAGGALLDLGVYSLTWVFQTLYHVLPDSEKKAPLVTGTISRHEPTGVDADNVVVCTFPKSIGIASSGLRVSTGPTAVRIFGTKGEIQVARPAYNPTSIRVLTRSAPVDGPAEVEEKEFPHPGGYGMFWEADGAARCLRDGKKECETMPLDESLLVMRAMDAVREIDGFKYPDAIESTDH